MVIRRYKDLNFQQTLEETAGSHTGGFLKLGTPQSSRSDRFCFETHGDLRIPHDFVNPQVSDSLSEFRHEGILRLCYAPR